METTKSGEELLAEVYRNTQYARQSIENILPATEDEKLRDEIKKMHDGYEQISGEAALYARNNNIELKKPNPIKKAMMWGSVKMNTAQDNSPEHIAEMLTLGTVMGITALKRTLGESKDADADIRKIANNLLHMEQSYERTLKTYL